MKILCTSSCRFSQFVKDNISLFTNLISLALILVGYLSAQYGHWFKTIGYFALSGAITNWLAIYMLFEKIPFLYGSGVIPDRFEEFKQGIKALILKEFFNEENLRKFFETKRRHHQSLSLFHSFAETLDYEKIYQQLLETLLQSSFGKILNMVGGTSLLDSIKEPIIQKLKDIVLQMAENELAIHPMLEHTERGWIQEKVEHIIDHRLQELTPHMIKQIMQTMIQKHLGWLVVWGGVFGGLIGLIMEAAARLPI